MAEKASLMLEAAKKNDEIVRLTDAIDEYSRQLSELPNTLDRTKREARAKAQASFVRRQEELRERVESVVARKRQAVVDMIDSFPELESKEFAGKFEIRELERHLQEVYPAEMIEDYVCMDPLELDSDEEAFRLYSGVESAVMSLSQGGGFVSRIFNGITGGLMKLTDNPSVGLRVVPAFIIAYIAGIWFAPFLFLTLLAGLGVVSAFQGFFVKRLLRKLYSVKLYLNTSYDEDIFQKDKSDILYEVDNHLEDTKFDFLRAIDTLQFEFDTRIDTQLEHEADIMRKRLEQSRDLDNATLQKLKDELADLVAKIEELEEAERKKAEHAFEEYMGTIKWDRTWMEHVFVDVSAENKLLMLPFAKANSCYYSRNEEQLKQFSRLVVFQALLRMHPEYASQVVLDYKYMGGELTQFLSLEGKCVRLCFTEEELRKQLELMNNEIKARTKSILSSSPNLDEFNKLMSSYGATGEYYVIVHIFGLQNITSAMLNWFRNGPRVGYIFKFYWTVEDMEQLKDDIPLSDIEDFYEIAGNPIPRTPAAVKRIVGLDS